MRVFIYIFSLSLSLSQQRLATTQPSHRDTLKHSLFHGLLVHIQGARDLASPRVKLVDGKSGHGPNELFYVWYDPSERWRNCAGS